MRIPSFASRRRARIEIIPLIDIVFFLLATFVMVSLSMVKNEGVPVRLPAASSAGKEEAETDAVTISLTREGGMYFNGEPIARGDIPARLSALRDGGHDPKIVIHGDEASSLGDTVYVLDESRKLGFKKVSIRTRDGAGGSPA